LPLTTFLANLLVKSSGPLIGTFTNLFGGALTNLPFGPHIQIRKEQNEFKAVINKIIKEKKTKYEKAKADGVFTRNERRMDLIETLFDAVEHNEGKDDLVESDIIDEFVTFFMAGMDTTAHLASIVPYFML